MPSSTHQDRAETGIPGLDTILRGGLPRQRSFLVHGEAGTGKSTLGMQFLLAGLDAGETALYVSLLQSRPEIEAVTRSHNWDISGLHILELPTAAGDGDESEQTVFSPADVELTEAVNAILEIIDDLRPARVVIDSISELAILVESQYQLRRQMLRLKHRLTQQNCTALLTAQDAGGDLKPMLTLVHGVIALTMQTPAYGSPRRVLQVSKMRGMKVSEGIHDFRIRTGGLVVYPRLEPAEERHERKWETIPSGIDALDALVGGGLERGTSCLITGTAGAGKSTIASLYTATAARRGEHVIVLCFDERKETFVRRAESLGLGVAEYVEKKRIDLRQIDVGELSLGHLMHLVAESVEKDGATIVVIDSLAGLQHAMPGEKQLLVQLHELLAYLSNKGVLALMVLATHGLFGNETQPVDASYIADTVIFARHFEARGMLRRCISVVKKRYGPHEKSIRELDIQDGGLRVGPPLKEFSGVLTGVPRFEGSPRRLLAENDEEAPRNNA